VSLGRPELPPVVDPVEPEPDLELEPEPEAPPVVPEFDPEPDPDPESEPDPPEEEEELADPTPSTKRCWLKGSDDEEEEEEDEVEPVFDPDPESPELPLSESDDDEPDPVDPPVEEEEGSFEKPSMGTVLPFGVQVTVPLSWLQRSMRRVNLATSCGSQDGEGQEYLMFPSTTL